MSEDTRPVSSLAGEDIGKDCRIEHEGWIHTGRLTFVQHERGFRDNLRAFVGIESEGGSRWMKHLDADHPIEIREGAGDGDDD